MTTINAELPSDTAEREPKGYTPRYLLASFGLFLAIFAPVLGGLSVKVQTLVGLDQAPTQLGLVTGVGALFALISQPLAGRLSDRTTSRFGMRKPWIIVGVVGAFLSLIGVGLAPNIPVLLVAFCGAQLFSNFAQAAEAVTVADQVPPERRGLVSGLIGAASPVAILIAAVGLSLLPTIFLKFAVPGIIGLVFGLYFAFGLKDRVLREKPDHPFGIKDFLGSFVFNPKVYRNLGWAWLTKALIMFGYAATTTYLTLYLATKFGMTNIADQLNFNLYATAVSTVFMVLFSVIGGRISDRLLRRRIFVTGGGILVGLGVIVMGLAPVVGISGGLVVILVAEAILGAGAGLFFAVDAALCIEVLPNPKDMAKDLGVLNIANTLPQTLAPFIAGTLVIPLVNSVFTGAGYSVWFVLGGCIAIVGGLLVYKIKGVK
ncbi:MAG TPA: MFS transporter [Lacisediminihabitans sp.]|uniref:MFS transporter n=1 Tax=Lacisediminihabitans sp. TaxID=2787631 RepID=UPI002EDA1C5B